MQYLLMLAEAPNEGAAGDDTRNDDGDDGVFDDWAAYTLALQEAGVLVAGAGLHGVHSATSVRVRKGRRMLTDGPFTETKEHVIGFYVLDVPDLDAALDWAAKVPIVRTGTVEVRPIAPGTTVDETLRSVAGGG